MSAGENEPAVGFYYDENFDWTVNAVGDVGVSRGVQKLASALSYFLKWELQEYVGGRMGLGVMEDVRQESFKIINRDERIVEVLQLDTRADTDTGTIHVDAKIDTVLQDEEIELTFPISEMQ